MAYPTNPSSYTDILSSIPEKFEAARKSGELFFFPSEAKDVYSQGRRFNLRLCPALQDKSKAKSDALASVRAETDGSGSSSSSPERKRARVEASSEDPKADGKVRQDKEEPFRPPYVPELYVGCLEGLEGEEGMSVLFNKYSLLPEHILLCTISPAPQSLPPTPPQLCSAYNLIQAASRHPTRPKKLLGFYNGGEGAGASQSWRHFQVIEVPGGRAPVEDWVQGVQIDKLDQAIILPNVPYLHIVHPLPPSHSVTYPPTTESNEQLVDFLAPALMRMLDLAFDALRSGNEENGDGGDPEKIKKSTEGGWNLLMTLDHLHLIPRSLPSFPLPGASGEAGQSLELNSLGYAGMMLVRSAEEEQTLMREVEDKGGLMHVLQKCGVPTEWGQKAKVNESVQQGSGEMDLV